MQSVIQEILSALHAKRQVNIIYMYLLRLHPFLERKEKIGEIRI